MDKVGFGGGAPENKIIFCLKWSKVVQKGPIWSTHLDPFGSFQTKIDFLPQMDKVGFGGGAPEQNINFCLKWSEGVHMLQINPTPKIFGIFGIPHPITIQNMRFGR